MHNQELVHNYTRFYKIKHEEVTEMSQVQRILDSKILEREGEFYRGIESIFSQYQADADKEPVLDPIRAPMN